MKLNDVFPGNFLKSADLMGKSVRVTIDRVTLEEIGDDEKPVMHFAGKSKGMVINKTNWGTLVNLTGQEDSDRWGGWSIVVYSAKVGFQGKMVDGLRVDDRPGAAKPPHDARNQSTGQGRQAQRPTRALPEDEPAEDFADLDADHDGVDLVNDDSVPF